VKPEWQERWLLLLCAGILAWQLFLPGFIGMANNGDFGKVAGPLSIGGADHGADNFVFFQPQYVRGPEHYYIPKPPSSEIALAWLASTVQKAVGDAARFDIRWLGAVHALIFLGFYYTVLVVLRPYGTAWRLALSLAALWIFADVGTLAYFNSFYMDVAAMLGALAASMVAVRLISTGEMRPGAVGLFGAAALLYVTSKGQHGVLGFVPALGALAFAVAARGMRTRVLACAVAAVVMAGSVWTLDAMPDWYRGQSRFDLIFFYITKNSPTPAQDLRELGLGDSDLRYVGTDAFMAGSPMAERDFVVGFCERCTYARVLAFYGRHPGVAAGKLWSDLRELAPQRRPVNLSNFQRAQGMPAGARTERLGSWSRLRSALFRWWPAHMVVWYGIALVGFPLLAMRSGPGFRRSLAWVICAIAVAGAAEFGVASLADAVETDRHLLLFHLLTDVTMFLALVWAAPRKATVV
jgi:hypothetical protein